MTPTRLKHLARVVAKAGSLGPKPVVTLELVESGTGRLRAGAQLQVVNGQGGGLAEASPGDVLFGKLRPYLAKVWLVDRPCLVSTEFLCLRPEPGVDSRWLSYVAMSKPVVELGVATSDGSKMPRTNWEKLAQQRLDIPSLEVQREVADYLDRMTAGIDAMIDARRRQAVLLQQGLDSQLLKLVDPSNKSIGQLPIKRILQKQSRPARSLGVVTAFRNGSVTLRNKRRRDGFTESTTRSDYQGVRQGDLVFHGLDGFAGAIGVSEDDGICSSVYHVCTTFPGFDSKYVALALRALALSGFLSLQAGNVRERAVDFRNWDSLARIRIPVPSLEQQRTSATAYVDRRRWADSLSDGVRRQVALFKERRQALITAAVAGQLDISEAAA